MIENLIGATTAVFPIRLSVAVTSPVDVEWATRDGSAVAGSDYKATAGTVTFLPGETEKQIEVQVYGQAITPADDKIFFIRLNPPSNAVLVDAILTCTINIIDDQGTPSVAVVIAEGRRGPKGDPGLSAYEQAVLMGYTGTLAEWMDQIADASKAADRAGDHAVSAAEDALKAQNAAKNAVFAGVVFPTAAEGVDPILGVKNGAYFNVRSPLSEHYIDEYQNVNGVAVATGKSYPTSDHVKNISDHTALPFVDSTSYKLNQRVVLANGDIVKSTIDGNANDPNVDMTGWVKANSAGQIFDESGKTQQELNDNLSFDYSVLNRSIKRSLYDKVSDQVSIKDYGAIGDGTLHTVQEWIDSGKFDGLTAIQFAFPHVWSLNNSVDWAATHLCLKMQRNIYAPAGTYVFNDELNEVARTVHSGSVNRIDSGLVFYGDGTKTVFTRNNTSPATRIINSDTGNEESISLFDDLNNAEAVFGIHCSSVKFRDFIITNSKIGFYFGQSLSESELSACYFNTLENLTIRNVGTGILLSSAYGNHYNSFNKIHFIQCQIDCEMRIGKYDLVSGADANNNRNSFINIRSNRSRVALYCKSGDTNRLYAWDGEGCGTTATNNPFPVPQGLPVLPNETRLQTCVYIFTGKGQINRMVNCTVEKCEVNLYNNQNENEFLFSYMQEDQAGEKCWNIQEPKVFITHKTYVTPHYYQLSSLNNAAFPNFTDLGFVVRSNSIRNTTGVLINKIKTSDGYHEHRFINVGSVASGNTTTLTVWRDVDPEASAFIKVKISANSTSGNTSFANEVAISARRNATRTVTRYFMQEVLKMRSNGTGTGDLTGITPSLQLDGRELKLVLTAPSATSLESIHADVEIVVSR